MEKKLKEISERIGAINKKIENKEKISNDEISSVLSEVEFIINDYQETTKELNVTNEIGIQLENFISVTAKFLSEASEDEEKRNAYTEILKKMQQ